MTNDNKTSDPCTPVPAGDLASLEQIRPDAILPHLKASNKKQVLRELARRAALLTKQPEEEIFLALMERERLGSTGTGQGIAIPHCKLANLDRVYAIFARLERPIPFDAIDDRPVDLIFLLLAPYGASTEHLKALAKVSRLLRNGQFCTKVRGSTTVDAISALINVTANKSAA